MRLRLLLALLEKVGGAGLGVGHGLTLALKLLRALTLFRARARFSSCGTDFYGLAVTPALCLLCRSLCRSPPRSPPRPAASRCVLCPRGSWGSSWRGRRRGNRTAPVCRQVRSAWPRSPPPAPPT